MQLIKDFNDIQRFVSFLNSENQQKLLFEINSLLVKYMDEQTKSSSNSQVNSIQNTDVKSIENEKPLPLQPIENKTSPVSHEASVGLNALKSTFASKGTMPPPPPLQREAIPMTRSITAGALSFKANINNTVKQQNKKPVMSLVDSWEFITPELTDIGTDLLKNPNIKSDLYQLLKQIDGQTNLKELFLFLNENSSVWAKFLGHIYPLYRERGLNLKKQRNFPSDTEISVRIGELIISQGLISEEDLNKALEYQKNPPEVVSPTNTTTPSNNNWMDKAKSAINNTQSSNQRKKIGQVMIELKLINQEDLDNALTLQKWIKNILLHG